MCEIAGTFKKSVYYIFLLTTVGVAVAVNGTAYGTSSEVKPIRSITEENFTVKMPPCKTIVAQFTLPTFESENIQCPSTYSMPEDFERTSLQPDKQFHFWAGVIIGSFSYVIHGVNTEKCESTSHYMRRREALEFGITMAVVAGAIKEIADALGSGDVEWEDFVYTASGGVMGSMFSFFNIEL